MSEVPAHRPTLYSEDLANEICARIADGQSVRELSLSADMPDKATIFRWLPKYPDFRDQYAKACEARTQYLADELLDIADGDGDVQRDRLRVDTRKWVLSKLQPKKYGNKVTAEITGADGGPVQTEEMSSLEIARRVAFLLASAGKEN